MHTYTHAFKHPCTHACLHICSAVIAWCTHPRVTHPPQTLSRSPHGPRCPPRQSHGWSRRTHPDQPLHASTCLAGQHLGQRCNNISKNIGMKHDATQQKESKTATTTSHDPTHSRSTLPSNTGQGGSMHACGDMEAGSGHGDPSSTQPCT